MCLVELILQQSSFLIVAKASTPSSLLQTSDMHVLLLPFASDPELLVLCTPSSFSELLMYCGTSLN